MKGAGRRVAITGYGVVAPCGIGRKAFWDGLNGPGITDHRSIEIADWDPSPYFDSPKESRRADRVEQFAVAAAAEAFEHAGRPAVDSDRFGTIFATGVGGLRSTQEQIEVLLTKGERRVSPFLVPMMMPNAPGAAISMRYGLRGPNETICTACAASTHAIGYAARLISWGMCDAVVTGGAESAGCAIGVASFGNMTALSTSGSSRPFDVDRDGFVLGEGAAVLILEEWSAAEARGATILGEVLGAASNADAHHITAPAPGGVGAHRVHASGARRRRARARRHRPRQRPRHVDPLNDAAEAAAVSEVFGPRRRRHVDQGRHRARTRCGRSARGHRHVVGHGASIDPTHGRHDDRWIQSSRSTSSSAARDWTPAPSISNSLGFGGHNGSIIIGPV